MQFTFEVPPNYNNDNDGYLKIEKAQHNKLIHNRSHFIENLVVANPILKRKKK